MGDDAVAELVAPRCGHRQPIFTQLTHQRADELRRIFRHHDGCQLGDQLQGERTVGTETIHQRFGQPTGGVTSSPRPIVDPPTGLEEGRKVGQFITGQFVLDVQRVRFGRLTHGGTRNALILMELRSQRRWGSTGDDLEGQRGRVLHRGGQHRRRETGHGQQIRQRQQRFAQHSVGTKQHVFGCKRAYWLFQGIESGREATDHRRRNHDHRQVMIEP